MQLTNPVVVVGIFFVVLFFVALGVGLLVQRRKSVTNAGATDAPDWAKSVGTPPVVGERMASPISEAIEDMVRERLAADPTLQGVIVDFGSTDDGGLEIWVDDERFTSVNDIRHDRIKTIIEEAVNAYNEGTL